MSFNAFCSFSGKSIPCDRTDDADSTDQHHLSLHCLSSLRGRPESENLYILSRKTADSCFSAFMFNSTPWPPGVVLISLHRHLCSGWTSWWRQRAEVALLFSSVWTPRPPQMPSERLRRFPVIRSAVVWHKHESSVQERNTSSKCFFLLFFFTDRHREELRSSPNPRAEESPDGAASSTSIGASPVQLHCCRSVAPPQLLWAATFFCH